MTSGKWVARPKPPRSRGPVAFEGRRPLHRGAVGRGELCLRRQSQLGAHAHASDLLLFPRRGRRGLDANAKVGPRYVRGSRRKFLGQAFAAATRRRFPSSHPRAAPRLCAAQASSHRDRRSQGQHRHSAAPIYIEVGTDALSLSWLHLCAAQAAGDPKAGFTSPGAGGETLTGAQVMTIFSAVAAFVQSCLAVLRAVVAAIDAGTITTTAQVDAPPAPLPPWPVNS